jgi:hypothetical protein
MKQLPGLTDLMIAWARARATEAGSLWNSSGSFEKIGLRKRYHKQIGVLTSRRYWH